MRTHKIVAALFATLAGGCCGISNAGNPANASNSSNAPAPAAAPGPANPSNPVAILPNVKAAVDGEGRATAHPVTIGGVPLTPGYRVDGKFAVTAQWPNKPHLTIDGDVSTVVTEMPGVGKDSKDVEPDAVLIRVPNPGMQIRRAADPAKPLPPPPPPEAVSIVYPFDPEPARHWPAHGDVKLAVLGAGVQAPELVLCFADGCLPSGSCSPPPGPPPPAPPAAPPAASANGCLPRQSASAPPGHCESQKFARNDLPAAQDPCVAPRAAAAPPIASGRPCGVPQYARPSWVRTDCEPDPSWDRGQIRTGLRAGEVGWSPFEECGEKKAGLGEACPSGLAAIVKGIIDLLAGRWI